MSKRKRGGKTQPPTRSPGGLTASKRQSVLAFSSWVGCLAVGFAVLLLLWNRLVQFEHRSSDQSQDVLLLANYPRYLPTDDLGGVVITVVNTGQRPIIDTVVTLVCGNTEHVCMDFDQTNRVRFGNLEPDERKTKLIRFQISHIDAFVQKVQIDLLLSARRGIPVTTTLQIEPTIVSLLPVGVSSLVLNRTFTVPNVMVAVAAVVTLLKSFGETRKLFRERYSSAPGEQPSSRA